MLVKSWYMSNEGPLVTLQDIRVMWCNEELMKEQMADGSSPNRQTDELSVSAQSQSKSIRID